MPEIVAALVDQLKLVKLDDGQTPAFEQVEKFDVSDLEEPFRLLLVSKKRVALVIPMDEQFPITSTAQKLIIKRSQPVAILFSDFAYGDRQQAFWGSGKTPGSFRLMELSLPFVVGQLIANSPEANGVVSVPSRVDTYVVVSKRDKNLPGRSAVSLELECKGGTIEAKLDLGANL